MRPTAGVNLTLTAAGQSLVFDHRAVRDAWLSDAIAAPLTEEQHVPP